MNRRDFLKLMGGLGISAVGGNLLSGCHQSSLTTGRSYHLPEWTGDSFAPMHRIRDGHAPVVPKPSQDIDLVIIGGGLTGLTLGYLLKDSSFCLLEREQTLGGNAKSGEYQGISYALGSAYLVDIGEPYASLYQDLGLSLNPLPHPVDWGQSEGCWLPLESGKAGHAFQKLQGQLKQFLTQPDFPSVPIEKASLEALRLDNTSFYDYLKDDTPPELLRYIDAYCYSALGGGIQQISAYAGINFYSEIAGEVYAFPGGNGFIAQRLVEKIRQAGEHRLQTGVSVYNVEPHGDRVWVSYFKHPDATPVSVAAKAVVVATPYFFAGRILKGLTETETTFLKGMQYGSYLVANCCFDQRVFQGGYDHWLPENPAMTDFIAADYSTGVSHPLGEKSPAVLTVYAPFRKAMAGRGALLAGNKEAFARGIEQALQQAIGFPQQSLREIRLTRYGHQLLSSRVGLIQQLRNFKKQQGRVILAHSDGQGMAAIESAITEAYGAVPQIKALLAKY